MLIVALILSVVSILLNVFTIKAMLALSSRMDEIEKILTLSDSDKEDTTQNVGRDLMKTYNSIQGDADKHIKMIELSRQKQNDNFLLPVNLTDQEKEILKEFYGRRD